MKEQLYAIFGKETCFLNQIKAVNHIYLLRSNICMYNSTINNRYLESLTREYHHDVKLDRKGQVLIDKNVPYTSNQEKKRHCQLSKEDAMYVPPKKDKVDENKEPDVSMKEKEQRPENNATTERSSEYSKEIANEYWIQDLGLKIVDRAINEVGSWLTNTITNAPMLLMKI